MMAMVRLELAESQVAALVQQLSPSLKLALLQMLIDELGLEDALGPLADEEEFFDFEEEDASWGDYPALDRRHLLAAEIFGYSYANYDDHLGVNLRFDEIMPADVDTLEQDAEEDWDDGRLAQALEVSEDRVGDWRESYRRAVDIVDAPSPAEAFRRGVRYSILDAVERGLADEDAIERLVTQVCYRAADLAYLLDMEAEILSTYSEELRETSQAELEAIIEDLAPPPSS
jgi:hypothetical protein